MTDVPDKLRANLDEVWRLRELLAGKVEPLPKRGLVSMDVPPPQSSDQTRRTRGLRRMSRPRIRNGKAVKVAEGRL